MIESLLPGPVFSSEEELPPRSFGMGEARKGLMLDWGWLDTRERFPVRLSPGRDGTEGLKTVACRRSNVITFGIEVGSKGIPDGRDGISPHGGRGVLGLVLVGLVGQVRLVSSLGPLPTGQIILHGLKLLLDKPKVNRKVRGAQSSKSEDGTNTMLEDGIDHVMPSLRVSHGLHEGVRRGVACKRVPNLGCTLGLGGAQGDVGIEEAESRAESHEARGDKYKIS